MNEDIEQDLTISLLIQKLQDILEIEGDLPVYDWVDGYEDEIKLDTNFQLEIRIADGDFPRRLLL
jgi:hypothetical protein